MAERPRHPDKDIERLIQEAERRGWRFIRRKYYIGYCPCGAHIKTIHLTPSGPNYQRNLTAWLRRQECWQ